MTKVLKCARQISCCFIRATLLLLLSVAFTNIVLARKAWVNSPLPESAQITLEKSGRYLKSGKFEKAKPGILAVLESTNDIPSCLAIAQYTEQYAYPMLEIRRQCLRKALSLGSTRDDFMMVALKARQYQFFEITRQAVNSLIQDAKDVPSLFELAYKAQEVVLHDVAHLAMEKAYAGIKTVPDALIYAQKCKELGMEDLVRKVLKDLIDDENEVFALCDLCLKIEPFQMRDQNRYLLRKAMDKCSSVSEMQDVYELARRLNEPDVATRALYFVRKGKLIQKIKQDQESDERRMRALREGEDLDKARREDAQQSSAAGNDTTVRQRSPKKEPLGSGF